MSRRVGRSIWMVGLSATILLGACGKDSGSKDKAAPVKKVTTTTSTTTTVPSAPPTTVLGPPESYKLPPSWPTDPAQADPKTADLVYVEHVLDAFAVIDQMAQVAQLKTMSNNDEVQTLVAEYAYNDEMLDIELAAMQRNLDRGRKMLPGGIHRTVEEVVSISPRCFVARVTIDQSEFLPVYADPFPGWIWMGIPLDSRTYEVNPSPWRLLGHGPLKDDPSKRLRELQTYCSVEVD